MIKVVTFAAAEAEVAKPSTLRDAIRSALRNDSLYQEISPYLEPPGVAGSKGYDQGIATQKLYDWDAKHNKGVIKAMEPCHRKLWLQLYGVLGGVFQVRGGRVVGLLEHKPEDREAAENAAAKEAAGHTGGDIQ